MNIQLIKAFADFTPVTRGVKDVNAKFKIQEQILKAAMATTDRARAAHEGLARSLLKQSQGAKANNLALGKTISTLRQFHLASLSAYTATRQQAGSSQLLVNTLNQLTAAVTAQGQAQMQSNAASQREIQNLNQKNLQYRSTISALREKNKALRETTTATKGAGEATKGLLLSWESISRLLTIQILHQTVSLLSLQLRNAAREAGELQLKISEIIAISDGVTMSIEQWGKGIRKVSEQFGMPMLELSEAVYQTVSNQVAQGEDAVEFMAHASRLATAAVSSTTEAVQALTSVMNAYKLELKDTNNVSAMLFETIKLGRVRMTNLAQDLGQVTPIAAQLGIEIQEVLGALAQLTKLGMSSSEAVTQLRNVFIRFLMPTNEMKNMFESLGVSGAQAFFSTRRLDEAFRDMQKHAGGNLDVLTELNNRIRGLGATMEFTSQRGLRELSKTIDAITNAADSYMTRSEEILKTSKKIWDMEVARIKNRFLTDIGPRMLEMLNALNKGVGGFNNRIQDLVTAIAITLVPVIAALNVKLLALAKVHLPLTAAMGALLLTVNLVNKAISKQQKELDALQEGWMRVSREAQKEAKKLADGLDTQIAALDRMIDDTFTQLTHMIQKSIEESIEAAEELHEAFTDQFKDISKTLEDQLKGFADGIKDAQKAVEDIDKIIAKQYSTLDDMLFNIRMDLIGDDLPAQQQEYLNRWKVMAERNRQAISAGDKQAIDETYNATMQALNAIHRSQQAVRAENKKRMEEEVKLAAEIAKKSEELTTADPEKKGKIAAELRDLVSQRAGLAGQLQNIEMDVQKSMHELTVYNAGELHRIKVKNLEAEAKLQKEQQDAAIRHQQVLALQDRISKTRLFDLAKDDVGRTPKARAEQQVNLQREYADLAANVKKHAELTGDAAAQQYQALLAQAEFAVSERTELVDTVERMANLKNVSDEVAEALASIITASSKHWERATEFRQRNIVPLSEYRNFLEEIQQKPIINFPWMNAFSADFEKELNKVYTAVNTANRVYEELYERPGQLMSAQQKQLRDELLRLNTELAELKETVSDSGPALDKSTSNVINNLNRLSLALGDAIKIISDKRAERPDRATTGNPVQGEQSAGGLSYGSESFKTPGEFTFNQDSTRKLFNQFMTGNSSTASSSGSNVNVGDINITMQTHGNVNYDTRRLGNMIRREIRQGTLVL